ncbi:type ISP restriction/modification enzyme [Thermosynechococcus sp. B3]|uniref:type ISP restriction/modification enzyme n=1 Tax=Thermosynechococcus sp. B3 TaxID=2937793 RepID=UPI0028F42661|nr:type ISP restriction/modification enzyme [Thermosynechococcus sp. B3]
MGIVTSRDTWCYNFSQVSLHQNMYRMIDFYNSEVERFKAFLENKSLTQQERHQAIDSFVNTDPKSISTRLRVNFQ